MILKRFWIIRKPVFPLLFIVVIIWTEVRGIGTNLTYTGFEEGIEQGLKGPAKYIHTAVFFLKD
jgi:hypothetical protein